MTDINTQRPPQAPTSPWPVFFVASIAVFLVSIDGTVLFAAFAALRTGFPQSTAADQSWVLNAYTVVYAALLPPASLALVLGAFPADRRAVAMSLWGAVGGLAAALGPSISAVVVDALGWRWALFLNLPLGLIVWWRGRSGLTDWRDANGDASVDGVGIGLLIAAVGALAYGIVEADVLGWRSQNVLGASAGGLLLMVLVVWARRMPNPAVELTLFADRSYRYVNQAVRQMGAVLGVAATVTFVGRASQQSAASRSLYLTHVALALITAILCLRIDTAPSRR